MISFMVFTLLYYSTHRIRARTVLGFALLGILVIFSVATLRSGKILQLVLYKTSYMRFSYRYAIFTEPYMYIVMNIENFVNAVRKLEHFSYGAYTFDYYFAIVQLKYPMKEYFGLVETPYAIGGYNTHTIFWTFYRDFGIPGITVIPLLCGLSVGSVYYAMRRSPGVALLSYYTVMVFVMALSFFVNPLGFLWFIYIVVWLIIVLKLIVPDQPQVRRGHTSSLNGVGGS
jgi:oligosaccharide repeat unit polymerase